MTENSLGIFFRVHALDELSEPVRRNLEVSYLGAVPQDVIDIIWLGEKIRGEIPKEKSE